ncbi:MAG: TauD/TfdA family dioxygenase [Pigmentiphaga sp.]
MQNVQVPDIERLDYTPGPVSDGRADWRARDVDNMEGWSYVLGADEINTLGQALDQARAAGVDIDELSQDNFPLPSMQPLFERLLNELETGRGLFLLRGFPVDRYSKDDLRYMYVGLCKHLGVLRPQSSGGDYLGDVRNFNIDINSDRGRAYTSRQRLTFHSDQADVVGLLVLRTAKSGGLSKLASAVAIRNELARTRPDLLEALHQPLYWSWQKEQPPGELGWYQQPIYTEWQGRFSSYYIRTHINSAQRYEEIPRLTEQQIAAMDAIDELANSEEFHFSTMFQPGDLQFLNNHVILHSRTEFEDYEEPDRRRHLLRIWLSVKNSRPLHPVMSPLFKDQSPGAARGGYVPRDSRRVYETSVSVT